MNILNDDHGYQKMVIEENMKIFNCIQNTGNSFYSRIFDILVRLRLYFFFFHINDKYFSKFIYCEHFLFIIMIPAEKTFLNFATSIKKANSHPISSE